MIWQLAMPAPSMLRFTVSKYSSDAEDLSGDRFEFESPILTPLLTRFLEKLADRC